MSLPEKAKTFLQIRNEVISLEDVDDIAMNKAVSQRWVRLDVAEKLEVERDNNAKAANHLQEENLKLRSEHKWERDSFKSNIEFWTKANRKQQERIKEVEGRIAEANKSLNEFEEKSVYAKGVCLWIRRLREALGK